MLTILLATLLACLRARAIPISPGLATVSTAIDIAISGVPSECDCPGADVRSMYDIVKGCLVTIGACVYRAVHQNIPDPTLSFWGRLRVTIKVTFYALIAPEMMIWWALRQWVGAKNVARIMNNIRPELEWTITHGQFAQMGGFVEKDNKRVILPMDLVIYLKNNLVHIQELRLTEKEINDKSKGDALSKGLVAVQTTWFVLKSIVRLHHGLPLIELEVVTLAFATLNVITYALWWYKPLNVLCPIAIHVGCRRPDRPLAPTITSNTPTDSYADLPSLVPATSNSGGIAFEQIGTTSVEETTGGTRDTPAGVVGICKAAIRRGIAAIKLTFAGRPWYMTVWEWLMKWPFMVVAQPLKELFDKTDTIDATHMSTFHAEYMDHGSNESTFIQALSPFIGIIFGLIHFISWHSTSQTHAESFLWRVSSTILVVVPFILILRVAFVYIYHKSLVRITETMSKFFEKVAFYIGPIPYILARFCILILAFVTLHDLPREAFIDISWTSYIPHI
ncbi:hypothetical protein BDN72DRAFT_819868 [Pluteus cervinus]|uniref:Uncharacterized protein n=1 Tax=Pluteus cervinus TaxID=181527 RepID=A0ACD3AW48_9AGAR|nr:hypothetical protein BDN72DRAFT_819868 [Pluteus cervinus]